MEAQRNTPTVQARPKPMPMPEFGSLPFPGTTHIESAQLAERNFGPSPRPARNFVHYYYGHGGAGQYAVRNKVEETTNKQNGEHFRPARK